MPRTSFLIAFLVLGGCDAAFLHDVPAINPPNDSPCVGVQAPADLTATWSSAGADLTWTSSPDAELTVVVQKRGTDGVWGEVGRVTAGSTRYLDAACVARNSSCAYRVIASTPSCQTQPSGEVTTFTAPAAVDGLEAAGLNDQVTVVWSANNLFASEYVITRSVDDGPFADLTRVAGSVIQHVDAVQRNKAYCYRVRAVTSGGEGPETESCTPSGAAQVALRLIRNSTALAVEWDDVNRFETSTVVRRDGVEVATLGAGATRFDDAKIVPGQTYTYTVVVRSANGDSPPASVSGSTLDATISATAVSVTGCSLTVTATIDADTASEVTGVEGLIEIASDATTSGGPSVWSLTGSIDATAGVGSFDSYWGVNLPGRQFDTAFTHRLRFSAVTELVGLPTGAPFGGEGVQPWAGTPAPACGGAFGALAVIDAGGGDTTCARTNTGRLVCWGSGDYGVLGSALDIGVDAMAPHGVCAASGGLGCSGQFVVGVSRLAVGDTAAYAINAAGEVTTWGNHVVTASTNSLPTVQSGVTATAIAAGSAFACVLTPNNQVVCWGDNSFGELGIDSTATNLPPAEAVCVDDGGACTVRSDLTSLAVGAAHACASNGGATYCWGLNDRGQVGVDPAGGNDTIRAANQVSGLSSVVQLAAGNDFSCALTSGGNVYCWGSQADGSLGDGTSTASAYTYVPQQVLSIDGSAIEGGGKLQNVVAIAAGGNHACALLATGRAACWGYAASGQLGNDSRVASAVPRQVLRVSGTPLDDIAAITAGKKHTCAVLADASIMCWGDNGRMQLGNPRVGSDSLLPVLVTCDASDASCGVRAEAMYRAGVRGQGLLEAVLQ